MDYPMNDYDNESDDGRCPCCRSKRLVYDDYWRDGTYYCKNCKLEDIELVDRKEKSNAYESC